jgi:DNA end-binding protein Ku
MTFHDREYLVAVRALDEVLALHTLRFADELVEPGSLDVKGADRAPSDRELKMAGSLVETLASDFNPTEYDDTYRDRVVQLLEAKARGEQVVSADAEEPAEESDLLAALEASLKGAK